MAHLHVSTSICLDVFYSLLLCVIFCIALIVGLLCRTGLILKASDRNPRITVVFL